MKAHRSKSNYRIYTEKAIDDLKFIEECKKLHFPLDEIKRKLEIRQLHHVEEEKVKMHIQSAIEQMKQLRKDLQTLLPIIPNYDGNQQYQNLKEEGTLLIHSLSKICD